LRVQGLFTHQNPASVLLGICGMTLSLSLFHPYSSKMLASNCLVQRFTKYISQTFNKKIDFTDTKKTEGRRY
jgi:hypothetical protein